MRQDKLTIPFNEEEQPSRIELDYSASMIAPTDQVLDPYDDEPRFNGPGFDDELRHRRRTSRDPARQKQINSIEEVTEQETLNTFESER